MDLDMIRELVRLMKENGLSEIEIESQGEHVKLRGETPPPAPVYPPAAAPAYYAGPPAIAAPEPAPVPETAEATVTTVIIKSPIVGVFYHAPSPDKPPFVSPGDTIDENTVLCIIEAMKVMNEIKAEMRGVVHEVLASNGQPVEFGQPLFSIEPIP